MTFHLLDLAVGLFLWHLGGGSAIVDSPPTLTFGGARTCWETEVEKCKRA